MKPKADDRTFLCLASHCALKRLETPALYDLENDELYELDEEAFLFLASSPPLEALKDNPAAAQVAAFCLEEGLCTSSASHSPSPVPAKPSLPTLRYLLAHITGRCNLRCRHCFLGEPSSGELPLEELLVLAGEFARLQGMRFIVSGGEPLLHRRFWELNDRIRDFPFRSILLTNGTLVNAQVAADLRFHEVQVSIDGGEEAHDLIRGRGSFRKTIDGLRHLADAGVDLSVATMVHDANLGLFDDLREILSRFPLKSWSVDVPCITGSLAANLTLAADAERAASAMRYSFGGGYYGSSGSYACGPHLAAVMSDGTICKCGHFSERPDGHISDGLKNVWKGMRRFRLEEITCRCSHLESCRGGCRFRASLFSCIQGPDPIQCYSRGVPVGGDLAPSAGKSNNLLERG